MERKNSLILAPRTLDDIPEAVGKMCTDLNIGAVAIENTVSHPAPLLAAMLAEGISQNGRRYAPSEISKEQTFQNDHDWHCGVTSEVPMLRVWHHIKGGLRFDISRLSPLVKQSFDWTNEAEVLSHSFAPPSSIYPEPGDSIVFVDFGCPGITGTSSIHRTKLINCTSNDRLSTAYDITFAPV